MKKPISKGHTQHDSSYETFSKKQNYRDRNRLADAKVEEWYRGGGVSAIIKRQPRRDCCGDVTVLHLDCSGDHRN